MPEQPERSLADEPTAPVAPSPATGSASHPLGNPDGPAPVPAASIVDTILDLDELLSADVRRAEKTARFCTKPWLEADIEELEYELEALLDESSNPQEGQEDAAEAKAREIQDKRVEYGQAFRSVRMGQLSSDDWNEFRANHRDDFEPGAERPTSFYDDLIAASALRPPLPIEKVRELRKIIGDPQMDELSLKAWQVNAEAGVSIPKSPISSHVLRRARLVRS